jgi:hypothetical protein
MGLHGIKKLLHIKGNKDQNQEILVFFSTEWEKIFSSYSTGKGLISRKH